MQRTFEENRIIGAIGECAAALLFTRRGFHVENNADAHGREGRGPSLTLSTGEKIPRPDYTFSSRGVAIAGEIKTKCDRTRGQLTREEETGIDYQKWVDYRDYEKATGMPVFMLFVEYHKDLVARFLRDEKILLEWKQDQRITRVVCPDSVYGAWLSDLKPSLNGKPTICYGKPMIYFSLAQFKWSAWDCVDLLNVYIDQHAKTLV